VNAHSPKLQNRLVLSLVVAFCVLVAWQLRFLTDDAFISFRYAQNLVLGHGLVWNPGEWVEGYTNLLWTLLIAVGIWVGRDPALWAELLGISFFAINLLLVAGLGKALKLSPLAVLCAVLATGLNYTFAAYATGGLETALNSALISAIAYLAFTYEDSAHQRSRALLLGFAITLALFTRLDSVVIISVLLAGLFISCVAFRTSFGNLLLVVGIPAACLCFWTAIRLSVYGEWLPNTYFAKVSSSTSFLLGGTYLWTYLNSYLIFLPIALIAAARIRGGTLCHASSEFWKAATLAATLLCWGIYLCLIGGDFMEFRFLVPAVPFMILLLLHLAEISSTSHRLTVSVVLLLLLGSAAHAHFFPRREGPSRVLCIPLLAAQVADPTRGWKHVGLELRKLFLGSPKPILAISAAGAIPYYSELPAIDMFGLTDAWIARHGLPMGSTPGHQRFATVEYLKSRHADLVIPFPRVLPSADVTPGSIQALLCSTPFFDVMLRQRSEFPEGARVIALPMGADGALLAFQFFPHPAVDSLVASGRARVFDVPEICGG